MNNDDVTAELAQPAARHLLETATLCHLAYNGADGLPRVIPVAYHWTGSAAVICTATTAPKVRALTARPDVALTIDGGGDTPAGVKSIMIRGRATLDTVDGIPEEYLRATTKSMRGAAPAEFAEAVRRMYPQMVRIAVTPRWARFFDYGGGRIPGFLAELARKAG